MMHRKRIEQRLAEIRNDFLSLFAEIDYLRGENERLTKGARNQNAIDLARTAASRKKGKG